MQSFLYRNYNTLVFVVKPLFSFKNLFKTDKQEHNYRKLFYLTISICSYINLNCWLHYCLCSVKNFYDVVNILGLIHTPSVYLEQYAFVCRVNNFAQLKLIIMSYTYIYDDMCCLSEINALKMNE